MIRKKVENFIEKYNMLQQDDTVIVGLSGGADSVCLLWILHELHYNIIAVHVNHGIRGKDADEDEAYVKVLCEQWDIACESIHVNVPELAKQESMTLEEAGRKVRYEIFSKIAKEHEHAKIAVAHHMDDNTETILMNLFRGSGLKGISGIEPVRENIIRPLLCVQKKEIEETLREQGILWRVDATNFEADYTRNKMRLQIIPTILETFPLAGEHVLQTAQIASETESFLNKLAYQFIDKYVTFGYNEVVWNKDTFEKEDVVVQKAIIRQILLKGGIGLKDITRKHIEEICLLTQKQVGKELQLPFGWHVKTSYHTMILSKKNMEKSNKNIDFKMEMLIFSHDMEDNKKNVKFPKNEYTKWFDYDKIQEAVVLRTRQTGDRIQVNPMGTKKLKDYMIDAKIPKELRDTIPIVASGNQVLWVVGYRMSEAFQVTAQTKNIMQITILGGKENGR